MKHWKISKEKDSFTYVILKRQAIVYCKASKNIELEKAIEENKLLKLTIIKLIDLDTVLCDDSSYRISLSYTQRDEGDFEIYNIAPNAYTEIKAYLLQNFEDVTIGGYSFFRQSSWNITGLIAVLILTYIEYREALYIQANGVVESKIRRSFFGEISFQIANFLTPIGCLLIGGVIIAFFSYLILKALIRPKQGKLFTLGDKPRIRIE